MQAHVAKAGEQVVQPQAGAEAPRRHPRAPVRGQHERERADQMGRHLEQDPPLARCLAHQVELVLLEVAQAAVDQPRRMRRRAAREVALVHHGGAKAAQRGVARDPGAGDAAADDQHVHRLGRHRREGLGARAM